MAHTPSSVIVTETDSENIVSDELITRNVSVVRGAITDLKLRAQPGTGYTWALTRNDPDLLRLTVLRAGQANMPGGFEEMIFRLEALKPGDATVEVQYLRVFEKEKPPRKVFRLGVHIDEK